MGGKISNLNKRKADKGSSSKDDPKTKLIRDRLDKRLNHFLSERARDNLQDTVLFFPGEHRSRKKVLLLGAGEQGKRSFLLSAEHVMNNAYRDELARKKFNSVLRVRMLDTFKILLDVIQAKSLAGLLSEQNQKWFSEIFPVLSRDNDWRLVDDDEFCQNWIIFMRDPSIPMILDSKNFKGVQIQLSIVEMLRNIDKYEVLFSNHSFMSYTPDFWDILHTHVRLTGISKIDIEVSPQKMCHLVVVGGQRNERKKWIHCFEEVSCVLFFCSLIDYDMLLFEDNQTSRLKETLCLWDEISKVHFFDNIEHFGIIFSIKDILSVKIAEGCLPEIDEITNTGIELRFKLENQMSNPLDIEKKWVEFLKEKFLEIARKNGKKNVIIYEPMNLMDPRNSAKVLDELLTETTDSLKFAGLIR